MRTAKQLLITVAVLLCSTVASAHDIEVGGFYYNIISSSDLTVEVTHKGSSWGLYYEYSGKLVIPQTVTYNSKTYSVTAIGDFAFYFCDGLTSVTIPNSVTTIGDFAFYFCDGLISVTIPNSVTTIGYEAFGGCTGLTSVTIPNSVTTIGDRAFSDCTGLTSVTIGNSVTTIGSSAFEGCTGLASVTIPNSVTTIGNYAFSGCTGLTSITMPGSVTTIGNGAFMDCTGLTSVTIPNSVTTIGDWAFSGCTGLTSITIGNSVTTIGSGAFLNCTGLTSVTIPNSVTTIGDRAFSDCTGLTSVTIGNSVTTIGSDAFARCTGLTSVTIPNSVTTIGSDAFARCTGLTSIEIPNSVTTIGIYAFYNTAWYNNQPDGLIYAGKVLYSYKGTMPQNTPIAIKDGTLGIAEYAFYDCAGLTSIEIPNSVTTIGYGAFYNCDGLTSIYLLGETPPAVGSSNFTETQYTNTILYVPAGTLETYRNADTWKNFLNIQEVAAPGTPGVGTKKCATPVISYNNCGLDITCDTDEAEIHTTIKCSDANSYNSGRIDLSATYEITTYATLAGYEDSEIATATLCWVEKESDSTDIIEVIGNPVLICTNNGNIVVKGAEAGTEIAVYNINGAMQGTATANGSEVVINTSLGKGGIAIINIGSKAIKVVMQ